MRGINRPLSRRALMRHATVAPMAMIMSQVACGEMEAREANGRASVLAPPISDPHLKEVLAKAKKYAPDLEMDKYELVVRNLWKYFEVGAGNTAIDDQVLVEEFSYNGTADPNSSRGTGKLVADRLGMWTALGNHEATNFCAYLCGHKAAVLAGASDEISIFVYRDAWKKTAEEVEKKAARIRTAYPNRTPEEMRLVLGGGC